LKENSTLKRTTSLKLILNLMKKYEDLMLEARKELGKIGPEKLRLKGGDLAICVHYLGDWQEAADELNYDTGTRYDEKSDSLKVKVDVGPYTQEQDADEGDIRNELIDHIESELKPLNTELQKHFDEAEFQLAGRGTHDKPWEIMLYVNEEEAMKKLEPIKSNVTSSFKSDFEEYVKMQFEELSHDQLADVVADMIGSLDDKELKPLALRLALMGQNGHKYFEMYTADLGDIANSQNPLMDAKAVEQAKKDLEKALEDGADYNNGGHSEPSESEEFMQLPEGESTASAITKQIGPWIYHFDGSGGEFYVKTPMEEFEKWHNSEEAANGNPCPFEMAIPNGDQLDIYDANDSYPRQSLNLQDVNQECDYEFADWDEYLENDQS
jgi:hypothetical protein